MTARRTRTGAGVLLAAAGGLTLAGGTTAAWVRTETVREVGGVAVTDVTSTSGLELAPSGLALGLGAAVAGLALLVLRGRAQALLGGALVLTGLAALAVVVAGVAAAPGGDAAGGAVAAVAGACGIALAGVLALRPAPPPRLPERYDLDGPGDDEWEIASAEEDPGGSGQGARDGGGAAGGRDGGGAVDGRDDGGEGGAGPARG